METHAHHLHKVPGQKFWHYFFEFFMLFLAVFCGFLVENYREERVEERRAKQLAENLYKEIYADSISVQQKIKVREIKENECSYFIAYVKDSDLTNLSEHFYPSFSWALIQTQKIAFEPNDGILNQLRNSGELRYFKSSELQAAIGKLSVAIANIRNRHERENTFIDMFTRPFSLKYYDFSWFQVLTQNGKLEFFDALIQNTQIQAKGKIPSVEKFDRKEAENITSYYLLMLRATRVVQYGGYSKINHDLLQILRKEYLLE